ncbi:MAG: LptF/LptG family permease [Candidatus Gastranaerophilales bacterium]|nr:LptF/LptG family permease [Candidatus Gastranaerophilales bacterium]
MFRISIFDKYIFKQVFIAAAVCLLLFIIVWIAPETLVRIIRKIFIQHVEFQTALKLLLWEMPKVLGKALPVGILLGTIFTFDKLSKDSELSILRGIGLSFNRIILPALFLGAALALICFYVGDKLIPAASKAEREDKSFKSHFVYIQKDENSLPKRGVIVSDFTPNNLKNIIVIDFSKRKYDDAITFESIYFSDWANVKEDRWILHNVKKYPITPGGIYENMNALDNMSILEGSEASKVYKLMSNSVKRDRTFTNSELKEYMQLLKEQEFSDEYRFILAKYYQRFLHPLTCILFAVIGCLLGFSPPRSQRLVGFTVAVGIVFAYYITLPFFDMLAQKGVLPPFLAASLPFLGFILAIVLIKKYKDL